MTRPSLRAFPRCIVPRHICVMASRLSRDRAPERNLVGENDPIEAGLTEHLLDLSPREALLQQGAKSIAKSIVCVGQRRLETANRIGLERNRTRTALPDSHRTAWPPNLCLAQRRR